ncbi:MAG: cell division protein ZapA [Fibrobacter sp.]|nr:cell division protein ZapA [Fibrobacter sp.]
MGSSNESVRVVIYGKEYLIKADVDAETIKEIAQYVNSKMAEINNKKMPPGDSMTIAVLSALNIAGELFELKAKYEEDDRKLRKQLQDQVSSLSHKIDSAL